MDTASTSSRRSEYRLRRRVQFSEVDSAGIVHFSWYFRYMEEAEHALWRDAGLSIARPGSPVVFPRVAAAFDYHKPLRFEEEFEVHIQIVAISEKSMRYRCVLTLGETRIASGSTTIVCVVRHENGAMSATPFPPEIAGRFEIAAGADD